MGKVYFHEFPDVTGQHVVVVVAAKHLPYVSQIF
jgi:hypothetical protein